MTDAVEVAPLALGASALVVLAALGVLHLRRRASLLTAITVIVLTAVLAVAAGVTAAAYEMFLSTHDLQVALVVVALSGLVTAAATVVLARRLVRGTRRLRSAARLIGSTDYEPVPAPPTAELAELAGELNANHLRLCEARDRERALEASRRELVAWVSHDLRTPLAGLRAMAEALEDGVVTDPVTTARYHRQLRLDVERLSGMVDDLFELSRLQAGTLQLTLSRASLSDLVSDAVAAVDPLARARRVQLTGTAEGELPVRVDVGEVERVLANLLVNAVRHTPDEGTVSVLGFRDGRSARISVSDSCGGIPVTDLARVFDVGFRGTASRAPDAGGGLGLSIARGIVEAHDGEIEVANAYGGCRFTVVLPLAQPA